jgi:putative transposase
MKKSRFSEEKIVKILQEAESGVSVADLCRKHGMSDAAFYIWRQKYGGLTVTDLKRLKSLEEENRKLKKIVADQALKIDAIEDLLTKKF